MQNKYFISFIDDFTRIAKIYGVTKKDEAVEKFEYYCNWMKKQFNFSVKHIRTDNGGEYRGGKFRDYCRRNGKELWLAAMSYFLEISNMMVKGENIVLNDIHAFRDKVFYSNFDKRKLDDKVKEGLYLGIGLERNSCSSGRPNSYNTKRLQMEKGTK